MVIAVLLQDLSIGTQLLGIWMEMQPLSIVEAAHIFKRAVAAGKRTTARLGVRSPTSTLAHCRGSVTGL